MAGMFQNYRSKHHPDADVRLALCIDQLSGRAVSTRVRDVLRQRDRKLWLEMESSTLSGILIESLVQACPEKKFILTIRDVYTWCDSWINHNINSPPKDSSGFGRLDRVRLRVDDFPPNRHDSPLQALGFPSLAGYFQLWAAHNTAVLEAVPEDRLFIVKTDEIIGRMPAIASWLGVPPGTLRLDRAWLAAARRKHGVLSRLDPGYVRDVAAQYCEPLMTQYFPELAGPAVPAAAAN
jgi:hypothetical protein